MKGKAGRVKGEAAAGVGSPTSNTVDDHRDLESPKGWATEGSHGAQRQEGYVMGNMAGDPGRVQIRVQLNCAGCRAWGRVPGGLVPGAGMRLQKPVSLPQCRSASRRQP